MVHAQGMHSSLCCLVSGARDECQRLAAIHLRILREPDEVTPEDIVTICLARVGQHSFL
jgi:hypothetical protein